MRLVRQGDGTLELMQAWACSGAARPAAPAQPDAAERAGSPQPAATEQAATARPDAAERAGKAQPEAASPAADDRSWSFVAHELKLDDVAVDVEDRVAAGPVMLRLHGVRIAAEDVGNVPGMKSSIDASARVGARGRVHLAGSLIAQPFAADWRIDASRIDLVPLRPYFEPRTNIVVTRGSVSAKGRLKYAADSRAGPQATYTGDVRVSDFASLDRPTSQDLVRWQTLRLTRVEAALRPLRLGFGSVGLNQFYARITVSPDAKLNLQQLLAPGEATATPEGSPPVPSIRGRTTTAQLPAKPEAGPSPVSIGGVDVSNGEIEFSDYFIEPNYSAHLTDVAGRISALSPTEAGQVELTARMEGTAPVEVSGSANPFARELAMDLTGRARGIDLPPFTPYAERYAGYGIEKGKLSFEVHYTVDHGRLAATNNLVLDQLAFGPRVDSPTATKLPVLLAVALLKDRNGVINLNLPIQGTLDDPQFSIFGVLRQIFVNFLTKAVTAPFALLSSIAGGHGGDELSYIEFAPGQAQLSAPAQGKLRSLAKALTDRPGLELEATGRAAPALDGEGLRRAALEHAMRVQKQKTLVAQGKAAPSVDAVRIEPDERTQYLAAVYATDLPDKRSDARQDTDPPAARNADKEKDLASAPAGGRKKRLTPAQMEAQLLATYAVDDAALRALAGRRAEAVKTWLVGQGGVGAERIAIAAPKLSGDGASGEHALTRVDFAVRR
jgi:hypothetical protein